MSKQQKEIRVTEWLYEERRKGLLSQKIWKEEHFGGNGMWNGKKLIRAGGKIHEAGALWVMNCVEMQPDLYAKIPYMICQVAIRTSQ